MVTTWEAVAASTASSGVRAVSGLAMMSSTHPDQENVVEDEPGAGAGAGAARAEAAKRDKARWRVSLVMVMFGVFDCSVGCEWIAC